MKDLVIVPRTFAVIFAIPTPFDQSLQVCQMPLQRHLETLHNAGVTAILVNGTTGEFPSLTLSERKLVLEVSRASFPGKIFNNIGTCCVSDSLELLGHSHDFADFVVLLPPFYFAPVSEPGLRNYLSAILSKAKIRCFLYNFPRYTQFSISPELVRDLAIEFNLLNGIKDSDAGLSSATLIKKLNPTLQVFSGNDDCVRDMYAAGLDGVVTGGFNAFPEVLNSIRKQVIFHESEEVCHLERLYERWNQFCQNAAFNPISAVKLGISTRIRDYPCYVRPPLTTAARQFEHRAALIISSLLDEHLRLMTRHRTGSTRENRNS